MKILPKFSLLLFCTLSFVFKTFSNETESRKGIEPNASFSLRIHVADNKGKALSNVTIMIHELKIALVTNNNGEVTQNKIPSGKYLLEATYLGFSNYSELITIQRDTSINIILNEAVADHGDITVTGVATAQKVKQSAQAVSIVKRQDLLQNSFTNLIEGLSKKTPGLNFISTGPAIAKPIIRGLGYNRLSVINDGIKQEGQQWGDEHGIEIDDNSVQKAEIITGPASLMYGSDALGGVINIITNSPVFKNTLKGNIGYMFLDNNGLQNINANIAAHLNNGFNFNLYGTLKSAKDYTNKYDGRVLNSRYKEKNFGGYLGINKNWGYSHLVFSSFAQQAAIIEGERDAISGKFLMYAGTVDEHEATTDELNSRYMFTPFQKINHIKIASDNNFILPKGRLTVNIGYQNNLRKEIGNYLNTSIPDLFFDLKTYNYNVQYHLPVKNNFKTSIGVNGMYQTNENKAEEVLIPEYNLFDVGMFIFSQKTVKKTTFTGGLRFDNRQLNTKSLLEDTDERFRAINKSFANVTGSFGLAYEANKELTLKLNLAKGFRAPTVAELSSNGVHEGTDRYEFGDNQLKSENSLQLDAGLSYSSEHISIDVSAFYNNINNYIYYRKLSAVVGGDSLIINPDGTFTAFKFGQSNATLYGFETKIDIHPHPIHWLHFENSFSMVVGQFANAIENTKNLPFIPAPILKNELRADIKKLNKNFSNGYIKFEVENVFTQKRIFTAYNTETITNGYSLINFGLGADVQSKSKKICSIYFSANNITDVAYQSHLSRLKYTAINNLTNRMGVYNMGKNFSFKIIIPIAASLK